MSHTLLLFFGALCLLSTGFLFGYWVRGNFLRDEREYIERLTADLQNLRYELASQAPHDELSFGRDPSVIVRGSNILHGDDA